MLIQETHWDQTLEWRDQNWCYIHSAASKPKTGGVMAMLSRRSITPESLRWSEIVPGRLLHIRCDMLGTPFDILNVHQKVRIAGSDAEIQKNLAERAAVWKQLERCLAGLPYRDVALVAGDLNTVLPRITGLTGCSVGAEQVAGAYTKEAEATADMLLRAGLVACNTYGKRRHTYVHAKGKSMLDYVFTRRASADAEARRATAMNTPLASWRKGGHRVLLGSVSANWKPWRQKLRESSHAPAPALTDSSTGCLQQLRAETSRVSVAPAPRVVAQPLESLDAPIAKYWEIRAAFKSGKTNTLRQCFDLLKNHGSMMRLHREIKRKARGRKRQRNLETLEQAERAARNGDSRALFQCVKLLSGSRSPGGLRLRDENAGLLSAEQECEALQQYAKTLFQGEAYEPPPLRRVPEEWLNSERWQAAIAALRAGKAVPHGEPRIAAWKDSGNLFSERLSEISKEALCCSNPHAPVGWCSVQLAWLPKPPKPPTQPKNLRSVGLTTGDSKAFLLVLKELLSGAVFAALGDTPQFAYRKGMDTSNAILRASHHCGGVRNTLQQHRLDYTSRIAGATKSRLAGGMAASLDLAKAFDSVPHIEIQRSLEELQIDARLIAVVMRVHTQTQCRIRQAGREAVTMMTRGLRQGCPLPPVLYAAWTSRLCRLLDAKLGEGWCNQHSSIFADDTLAYWELDTTVGMRKAIRELGCLFSVIRQLGLAINFEKSGVMLALTGTDKTAIMRACACHWKGLHQLRVPMRVAASMCRLSMSCSTWVLS